MIATYRNREGNLLEPKQRPLTALRNLLEMNYRVPPQDLSIKLSRMPSAPVSGFVVGL